MWNVQRKWHQKAVLFILRQGVVPCDVAVVADGSRRYARSQGMELGDAYGMLIENLISFRYWMTDLGVTNLTSFTLSCRNFARATSELEAVLDKIYRFFATTLKSLNLVSHLGVWVRLTGDITMLPNRLQTKVAQVDVATSAESRKATWAVAAAYSTRHNTTLMVLDFAKALKEGVIKPEDITAQLISEYLAQNESPETQLWYRSGGEARFSEFLVLQSGYSYIHIDQTLFPAVGFWNLVKAIFMFQLHWPEIKLVKERH